MKVGDQIFIGFPSAVQFKTKGAANSKKGKDAINQLLWGDWAKVKQISGNWIKIRARGRDGWVRIEDLQTDRILEVNFVDVGQGDGCHIQTPKDKTIVIDAGEGDNMYRFLRWRFGKFSKKFTFESFVISHPDQDHYLGFSDLFEEANVHVGTVYHNTIVEQKAGSRNSIGTEEDIDGDKYITGLVHTKADLKKITDSSARRGRRKYPNMLKKAVDGGRVKDFKGVMASADLDQPAFLPGYGPGNHSGMTLKVLGPFPEEQDSGEPMLPRLGNVGETKNGHSVVFLLEIGRVRMLLGGDLNDRSQDYLLEHYTGLDPHPQTPAEMENLVNESRKYFEVDIAKACHHGSSHVAPSFLQAMNTLVTVISSGDNEPHSHPRPDTLGLIGKFSRSERPLIFSTELARSGNESIKHPNLVRRELKSQIAKEEAVRDNPNSTDAQKKKAAADLDKHFSVIERSVANYGMINVLTDGERVVIAQRLERDRSKSKRWDIYEFISHENGRLRFLQH